MRGPPEAGINNRFLFGAGGVFIVGSLMALGLIAAGSAFFGGLSHAGLIISVVIWCVLPLLFGVALIRASLEAPVEDTRSFWRVIPGAILMLFGVATLPVWLIGSVFTDLSIFDLVVAVLLWSGVPLVIGVRLLRR